MKRSLLVFAAIATLLLVLAAPAQASAAPPQPRTVATLPYGVDGSFAESMTAVAGGNLYASLTLWGDSNTGQIWKITPSGATSLVASIDLGIRLPERIAVLTLIALTIGGGLYPQPNVVSRYEAATQLIELRTQRFESLARTGRLPATTSRATMANDDNRD